VTHPELIEAAPRAVSVELDGTLTRGMTVVDQRRGLRGDPATAKVGYRIDAEQALQVVMESLGVEPEPS
jgi:inosine-uridine nucleoside N-ribohydrolase